MNRTVTIAFGLCFTLALGLIARGQQISGGGAGCTGACAYTGTQTITPAANTNGLVVSGGSITGSGTGGFGLNVTGTLNTSGTSNGTVIFGDILNTSSTNSAYIDLRTAGVQKYLVGFDGSVNLSNGGLTVSSNSTAQPIGGTINKKIVVSDSLYGASGVCINWSSASANVTPIDTALCRNAAGVTEANNGTPGTFREVKLRSLVVGGTAPTLTGTCTTGSQTGGATAGTFTATCTAQTVIITFAFTAPTGWSCNAHDQSTPADTLNQIASSTTTATLSGTTVAADVINFNCMAY